MKSEILNEAAVYSSSGYFTRSTIPGNKVGRKWNFDEDEYYNEPEWLPGDDENPEDHEIPEIYEYKPVKTMKSIEKKKPVMRVLVPVVSITRCAYLNHVPGINDPDIEFLNKWYQKHWRTINESDFNYVSLKENIKQDILNNFRDPVKIQIYLGAQKILYSTHSVENEFKTGNGENVSKSPKFRHFFSLALKNPMALNSLIIMTNCVTLMEEALHDHDAQLIIIDVLLRCYPCALENFVKLDGVTHIKIYLDYLASNSVLDAHINYMLKCFKLLGQLDITLDVLKQSKIGIPINIIATGKVNHKANVQYECSDIGVKVKASDLVKRWKCIRDEAMQKANIKTGADSASLPDRDIKIQSKQKTPLKTEEKGSFVLNILDTLVEEHEKGRKRKHEMRNPHKSSKKPATSSASSDSSKDKQSGTKHEYKEEHQTRLFSGYSDYAGPVLYSESSQSYDKPLEMQIQQPQGGYEAPTEPPQESGSETAKVQSLLNFFRTNEANKINSQVNTTI